MKRLFSFLLVLVFLPILAYCANGLVAHYDFNQGSGNTLKDVSGNGNDGVIGNADWVKTKDGFGLKFKGTDSYVDLGANPNLQITGDMTVIAWVKLEALRYFDFDTNWIIISSESYNESGYILRIQGDSGMPLYRSSQKSFSQGIISTPTLSNNELYHVVFVKKGSTLTFYVDGASAGSGTVKDPVFNKNATSIGQSFQGIIDDLRVYNRALKPKEISSLFTAGAAIMDKAKWNMDVFPQATAGTIIAKANLKTLKTLGMLDSNGSFNVVVGKTKGKDTLIKSSAKLTPKSGEAMIVLDASNLPKGSYKVSATLTSKTSKTNQIKLTKPLEWAGAKYKVNSKRGQKRLNNLVVELLNINKVQLTDQRTWEFENPYDGWIYVSLDAKDNARMSITFDASQGNKPAIRKSSIYSGTAEVMQYLSAGKHSVTVSCDNPGEIQKLIVRSIPELIYCQYPASSHVKGYGLYEDEFLGKYFWPHINTMVISGDVVTDPKYIESMKKWKSEGGRLFVHSSIPKENSYEVWSSSQGYQSPLADGVIVDEFIFTAKEEWTDTINKIYVQDKFKNKLFYGWALGGFAMGGDLSKRFADVVISNGGRFALEYYIPDDLSKAIDAKQRINSLITPAALQWEKLIPGSMRNVIMNLGFGSQPPESMNVNPLADFKVVMDYEMNLLANHPSLVGLYGIAWYLSPYTDEENMRWGARLFRHYAIEGKTNMLSDELGFKYELAHIKNPDFEFGNDGWNIKPASADSVSIKSLNGWSWLEGRYPGTSKGDTFIWAKRSASKPNSFSQTIKNLKPGKLYSLKMFTADYGDISKSLSVQSKQSVAIKIDGANILPEHSVQEVMTNCYGHFALGYQNDNHRAWMNYHWRVFRAKASTAKLTISDWTSEKDPGGPIGQEILYNFIEVQPYYPLDGK